MWRWDQGRLLYFQFDVLKDIAKVLVQFDNAKIKDCEPQFRYALMNGTGRPFAPGHYTVLRNYKRVFECAFLATVVENRLIITDFCRELAKGDGNITSVDDFLFSYISRFRFPFPAFDNYNDTEQRIYPFCAIIKHLLSLRLLHKEAKMSMEDIFHYIIANNCTGYEDMAFYQRLVPKAYDIQDTERRQLREMIIFISQLSILKVHNSFLHLDIVSDTVVEELLQKFLIPQNRNATKLRAEEFLSMTSISSKFVVPTFEIFTSDMIDMEFIEGKRKRVEHFRVERSPLLRRYYIEQNGCPVCYMCKADMSIKYPWTEYMIDIHHLLPLSSSVAITPKGTSLEDIVGLCPSCHRSIHIYYRMWLKKNHQDDFNSKKEAIEVFMMAAKEIA